MVTLKIRDVAPSVRWTSRGRAWCTCGSQYRATSERLAALWATMHIAGAH
jgi:hypothetical protein